VCVCAVLINQAEHTVFALEFCTTMLICFLQCKFSSSFGSAEFKILVYAILSFSVIQGITSVVSSSLCVFCVSKSGNCVLFIFNVPSFM
jgi:hypothetical protein